MYSLNERKWKCKGGVYYGDSAENLIKYIYITNFLH